MKTMTTAELLRPLTNSRGVIGTSRYVTTEQNNAIAEIFRRTPWMHEDHTWRDRAIALREGYTDPLLCYCGKPRHTVKYKCSKIRFFADHCSLICMNKSKETRKKRSAHRQRIRKKKIDAISSWCTDEFLDEHFVKAGISIAEFVEKYDITSPVLFRRLLDEKKIPLRNGTVSSHERMLQEWYPEAKTNVRWALDTGWELDLYFPDEKVAVELHGIYWHSEIGGQYGPNYHLRKMEACEAKGIRLLQFWHIQIEDTPDIVRSIIDNALGRSVKIGARKCTIVHPTKAEEREFFDKNHLQGFIGSSKCLALSYQGEIVSMISLGKSRFKKGEYELIRFCHKVGLSVTGGLSRLLKASGESDITTYVDRMWATGNGYTAVGFQDMGYSRPSYLYTKGYRALSSRVKFQKHKLHKLLENFDPALSEWENMKANGYDRVWDCGTRKLKWSSSRTT